MQSKPSTSRNKAPFPQTGFMSAQKLYDDRMKKEIQVDKENITNKNNQSKQKPKNNRLFQTEETHEESYHVKSIEFNSKKQSSGEKRKFYHNKESERKGKKSPLSKEESPPAPKKAVNNQSVPFKSKENIEVKKVLAKKKSEDSVQLDNEFKAAEVESKVLKNKDQSCP